MANHSQAEEVGSRKKQIRRSSPSRNTPLPPPSPPRDFEKKVAKLQKKADTQRKIAKAKTPRAKEEVGEAAQDTEKKLKKT